MEDRRRSQRKPLLTEVEYESGGVRARARIENIGTLGVFIQTESPLMVGTRLRLSFNLRGGRRIEAEGVVAHRQTGVGMGVAFISISKEEMTHIQKFIDAE